MSYDLGVDLGTTYTAAAIGRDGRVEAATLGTRSVSVPTVVCLADDRLLVGEPAARRAGTDPQRVARESKRRVGDFAAFNEQWTGEVDPGSEVGQNLTNAVFSCSLAASG